MPGAPVRIARDPGGGVDVAMPTVVRRFVRALARDVTQPDREARGARGARGAQEAQSADAGVPVPTAMAGARREAAGRLGATVAATWRSTHLSDEQAEAWLQVLGMALAARAERLGLTSEAQLEALGRNDRAALELIQVLQVLLVQALNAGGE